MLEAQIVGGLFNLWCNLQQVETADDPGNPVVAAYSLCIFGNIADAGVTAAGDAGKHIPAEIRNGDKS